ncbi:MAG: hypothetical protein WCH99_15935, partial [Verrucomicrobiota bacterium]
SESLKVSSDFKAILPDFTRVSTTLWPPCFTLFHPSLLAILLAIFPLNRNPQLPGPDENSKGQFSMSGLVRSVR